MVAIRRKLAFIAFDIVLINIILFLALFIRYGYSLPAAFADNILRVTISTTSICIFINLILGLYTSLWKYAGIDELITIIASSAACSLSVALWNSFMDYSFQPADYILFFILMVLIVGGSRMSYRILRRIKNINLLRLAKDYKRVMVIGAGDAGVMVIKEMLMHPEVGLKPVVIIDDDKAKHHSKIRGVPIYGGREKVKEAVEMFKIDEVIISMPSESKTTIKQVLDICKETKCKLKTLPGIYEIIGGKVSISQIRDVEIEDLLGREPVSVDLAGICGYLRDKVVLVTGGGGSIGSELCRQIATHSPKKLLILDIYENNVYDLQQELRTKYSTLDHEVIIASVRDRSRMEEIFNYYKPHVVFHAAAHKHVPLMEANPVEAIKNNVFGTLNVAECAHQFGTSRFVLISTDKAVNPTNIMGATKRIAEMIIQGMNVKSSTEFVAVRFGNVLGSNGSVIPLFKKQIAEGGPVTVTHPEINRFFMTIPEAVQLVLQAGSMAEGGEIFILDMGQPVKINDLARDLIRLSGLEPNMDIKIEYTGLRPGEKLYEELMMEEEGLAGTKHEKIFIAKPTYIDIDNLVVELEKLKFIKNNHSELLKYIKEFVPGYHNPMEEVAATIDADK